MKKSRFLHNSRIPFALASAIAAMLATHAAHAANGTWTQTTSGGNWSDTANWSGGTVADASSFTANFNTLDITTDNTVRLDSARTLTSLIFGDTDTSSAASWILDNNSTPANILTLAGTTPTITVNALGTNQTATISAVIAGTVGLTKSGVGTLVLSGDNTYTGTTSVGAGTLTLSTNRTATASTFSVGSVASSTGTLNIQGNLTLATGANQLNVGGINGGVGIINQTGGTVGFSDTVSIGVVVGQAVGGTGTYNLSAGTLTPPSTSGVGIALCNNNSSTGTFNLSGSGNLAAGSSTLNIGRWNVTTVTNSTPTFNQTGGTAAIGTLFLGGKGQNCQATLNLTGGTFTVTTFGGILGGANKASNVAMTVGGTATATLPAFPVKTVGNTATFTFDGGTLVVGAASASYMQAGTFNTATITSNGGTLQADTGKDATIAQNFGGAGPLTKTGSGTLTLTGTNTYNGATNVSAGTLAMNGSGSINNSSSITVAAGAKLVYNSSTALTNPLSLSGAGTSSRSILGGSGTISASVTLDNVGDTLSPGNSPGILTSTTAQTWSAFSYDWEVNNFTGTTAGTDFDQLGLNALNLTGGSGSYILNLLSLTALNVGGNVPNFSEINRSWTILTSSGITGFNAANWAINTTNFTNSYTGTWGIAQSGNDLVLSYTAVPEPNVAALLGGLGTFLLMRRRR